MSNFKRLNSLSVVDQLSFLERYILVHSYLYYHRDTNIIDDKQYDDYARHLEKLIALNDKEFKQSQYYYDFIDYTSATGFDLYDRLNESDKKSISNLADYVLKCHNKDNNKKYKK